MSNQTNTEQAEAPRSASTCGYAQCQGKPKCDFCEYGKIIDQPTASPVEAGHKRKKGPSTRVGQRG